jgi:hypothetical protein
MILLAEAPVFVQDLVDTTLAEKQTVLKCGNWTELELICVM